MCFVNNGGELKGINISEGTTFFVLTIMLPILDAATGGRVTPYRLWRLALSRGRFQENLYCAIKGVDYGPVEHYWGCDPQLFGKLGYGGVPALEETGTPEDIAELLRAAGYWMWMRPDRFPVDISHPTYTRPTSPTLVVLLADSDSSRVPISQLPIELLLSICSDLPLPDIITLATSSKVLYVPLLGTLEACDALAKTYMHTRARWCLPHGEAELKWWNDRNGDEALGWDYMRRCHVENHSMRNRRRIWRAAESIEDECEKVENGVDYSGLVDLFRPLVSLD
ncbi:hypothetical protein FRC12_022905 [Ceratobasidium sp. 428]|nr:hypothetical protein FRC12_022905 [Ceratobasidium sp. 428]